MTEAQYPGGGPNFPDRAPMLAPKRVRSGLGRAARLIPWAGPFIGDFLDNRKTNKRHKEAVLKANDPEAYRRRQIGGVVVKSAAWALAIGGILGAMDGAARAKFDAGSITGGTDPSKVHLVDTRMTHKVVVAEADMKVTAAESYKAAPLGEAAEILGLFYSRKLTCSEVPVKVQYYVQGQDFRYTFDENVPYQRKGGSPDRPTIKAELNMGEIGTTVVRTPDIRNNSCTPTSDGLFAPLAGILSKYGEQKMVKDVIDSVPGSTGDPAPEAQLDNLLRGVMDVHINQLAGEACTTTGKDYDFMQPVIKKLVVNAYAQAILDNVRNNEKFQDLVQPRIEDVQVTVTDKKPQFSDGYEIAGGIGKADPAAVDDLVNNPRKEPIQVGPVSAEIELRLLPKEKQEIACSVAPGAADGANTVPSTQPTEKGER